MTKSMVRGEKDAKVYKTNWKQEEIGGRKVRPEDMVRTRGSRCLEKAFIL